MKKTTLLLSISRVRDMAKAIFEHAGAEDISYTEEAGVAKEARA